MQIRLECLSLRVMPLEWFARPPKKANRFFKCVTPQRKQQSRIEKRSAQHSVPSYA
jgi:hypothetical protein